MKKFAGEGRSGLIDAGEGLELHRSYDGDCVLYDVQTDDGKYSASVTFAENNDALTDRHWNEKRLSNRQVNWLQEMISKWEI